jgi:hypothetical protein
MTVDFEAIKAKATEAVRETLAYTTYDCTRDWQAWRVGTMRENDFMPIAEIDERIDEIVEAVLTPVRAALAQAS